MLTLRTPYTFIQQRTARLRGIAATVTAASFHSSIHHTAPAAAAACCTQRSSPSSHCSFDRPLSHFSFNNIARFHSMSSSSSASSSSPTLSAAAATGLSWTPAFRREALSRVWQHIEHEQHKEKKVKEVAHALGLDKHEFGQRRTMRQN